MKRLVKKLAVAAVASVMVVALVGCDLLGTMQKSGLSPQLTKDRFSPPGAPTGMYDRPDSATFIPAPGAAMLMP